ncbi:hypothetical protein [Clostridium rectalis]|nr:hypothetical protein [Clostridium rectalis]
MLIGCGITSKEVGLSKEETKEMYNWYNFHNTINQKEIVELKKTQDF